MLKKFQGFGAYHVIAMCCVTVIIGFCLGFIYGVNQSLDESVRKVKCGGEEIRQTDLDECNKRFTICDLKLDQCKSVLGEVVEKNIIILEECRDELKVCKEAQSWCEIYRIQQKREKQ